MVFQGWRTLLLWRSENCSLFVIVNVTSLTHVAIPRSVAWFTPLTSPYFWKKPATSSFVSHTGNQWRHPLITKRSAVAKWERMSVSEYLNALPSNLSTILLVLNVASHLSILYFCQKVAVIVFDDKNLSDDPSSSLYFAKYTYCCTFPNDSFDHFAEFHNILWHHFNFLFSAE